jgi:hypothetical protein
MLWEMATGLNNVYRVLVPIGPDLECGKTFRLTGKPLQWATPPKVMPFVDPRRKHQKPRGDIEYITWGAIVLNERTYKVLHDMLLPFGEFLILDCLGEVLYFYNVTTLYSVIDRAELNHEDTAREKKRFIESAVPTGICIFKDELTVRSTIYVNDETKLVLEKMLVEHKMIGLTFGPAGSF